MAYVYVLLGKVFGEVTVEALRVCEWWLRATVDGSHSGIGISNSWQDS